VCCLRRASQPPSCQPNSIAASNSWAHRPAHDEIVDAHRWRSERCRCVLTGRRSMPAPNANRPAYESLQANRRALRCCSPILFPARSAARLNCFKQVAVLGWKGAMVYVADGRGTRGRCAASIVPTEAGLTSYLVGNGKSVGRDEGQTGDRLAELILCILVWAGRRVIRTDARL
jgi:hypothetical protein